MADRFSPSKSIKSLAHQPDNMCSRAWWEGFKTHAQINQHKWISAMDTWNAAVTAMPQKRMKTSLLLQRLASLHWYVSALIGEALFVAFKWILPALYDSELLLAPFPISFSGMAWFFSGVFLLIGGIGFATRKKQQL